MLSTVSQKVHSCGTSLKRLHLLGLLLPKLSRSVRIYEEHDFIQIDLDGAVSVRL